MSVELVERYQTQLFESFPFFLKEVWRLDRGFVPSRIQLDFAHWIAYGPARCGAIGFRGMAKTWITNCCCLWWLYRDIEEKIMLLCANEAYAKASLVQIRGWMESIPFLRWLLPDGGRDNTEELDVAGCKTDRIASIRALGLTGKLPGGRASKIIGDDCEQPENTLTRAMRELVFRRIGEVEPLLVPPDVCTVTPPAIRFLGTYQHLESAYDKLQKVATDRDYKPYVFRNWPIQYPTPDEMTPLLSPMLRRDLEEGRAVPGEPVWPAKFGREYIYSLNMGRTRFLQQYMGYQDSSSLQYPLKLEDLIVYPVNRVMGPVAIQWGRSNNRGSTAIEDLPSCGFGTDQFYAPVMVSEQWSPYVTTKAYYDPAGRGEDESAWAVISQLHGYLFVQKMGTSLEGPTDATLDRLVADLRECHAHEVYVEDTFGGEALIRLVEMHIAKAILPVDEKNSEYPDGWACAVIPYHAQSRGQKEMWICDTLETVLSHHRLVVDPEIARDTTLFYQFCYMTRERGCMEHEDRVEALAGAVAQFGALMGINPVNAREAEMERRKQARYEQYCKKHSLKIKTQTWSGVDPQGFMPS